MQNHLRKSIGSNNCVALIKNNCWFFKIEKFELKVTIHFGHGHWFMYLSAQKLVCEPILAVLVF